LCEPAFTGKALRGKERDTCVTGALNLARQCLSAAVLYGLAFASLRFDERAARFAKLRLIGDMLKNGLPKKHFHAKSVRP
jgi:hypothetical protein